MANIVAKVEVITPEVAKCYLEHSEGNRVNNKGTIAYYAKMMQEGEWQMNGEPIVFDDEGVLVNGHHRLHACVYGNVPFETMVVRNVKHESFYTYDSGRTRKKSDVMKIASVPNSVNVSAIINNYLSLEKNPNQSVVNKGAGGGQSSKSYRIAKVSNKEMLDEYHKNEEYWQNLHLFTDSCYRRCRLLQRSYVGGIVAYLNKNKGYDFEYVANFFEQLFFEEKTEIETIRMMRGKLIDDIMKGGISKMTPQAKEQLLIKTWEAYKSGATLKLLRWQPLLEKIRRFE